MPRAGATVALSCSAFALATAFAACATSGPVDLTTSPNDLFDGSADGDAACTGRGCKRVVCTGQTTTLRGRVFDPAGLRPVYGAAVYVPNGDTTPIPKGTSCRRCADLTVGAAVSALTDANGAFVLDDVPVDSALPVVVELGAFRRTVTWNVVPCTENTVPDGLLRLPRSTEEGELPRIAITTGGYDSLECLVRGIGIDDAEFVPGGTSPRHVHLYRGLGGGALDTSVVPDAASFWKDPVRLSDYQLVGLSCEGAEALDEKGGTNPGARSSMHAYAQAGGHVFATHFHRVWFQDSPFADFSGIAEWGGAATVGTSYDVDTSFPKGAALADWLVNVGASPVRGTIDLENATYSVGAVHTPARSWIAKGVEGVRYFSFNTPAGAAPEAQCGRVVFGDLHVSGHGGGNFPSSCPAAPAALTPEQLALEFLLFDALACVRDDSEKPVPPR